MLVPMANLTLLLDLVTQLCQLPTHLQTIVHLPTAPLTSTRQTLRLLPEAKETRGETKEP